MMMTIRFVVLELLLSFSKASLLILLKISKIFDVVVFNIYTSYSSVSTQRQENALHLSSYPLLEDTVGT